MTELCALLGQLGHGSLFGAGRCVSICSELCAVGEFEPHDSGDDDCEPDGLGVSEGLFEEDRPENG